MKTMLSPTAELPTRPGFPRLLPRLFIGVMTVLVSVGTLHAQTDFGAFGADDQAGEVFGGINFGGLTQAQEEPVTFSARYYASGTTGRLEVEAVVGQSWHIYSTTQPTGGPLPTKISVASPKTVSVTGDFEPDEPPTKSVSDIYVGVTIEEHDGTVVWSAPIKVPDGLRQEISVKIDALVCQNGGSCRPAGETLVAKYAGELKAETATAEATEADMLETSEQTADLIDAPSAQTTTFRDKDYEVIWKAGVSASVAAGDSGQLVFRAHPQGEFHVYKGVVDDTQSSTNFVVEQKSGLKLGVPQPDQPIISKSLFPSIPGLPEPPPVEYHDGEVTWSIPVSVPQGTEAGDYPVEGFVAYQACTDKSCLQPMAFKFAATITVGESTDYSVRPLKIESVKYATAIDRAAELDWVDKLGGDASSEVVGTSPAGDSNNSSDSDTGATDEPSGATEEQPDSAAGGPELAATGSQNSAGDRVAEGDSESTAVTGEANIPKASFPVILLMALAGGLILNLMPCVLPVIGLKIMSFAQQAGEDRKRVFLLNVAYVAGIMTVFVGLAILAVVFSFGWGQQFGYFSVRLGLTVMIFALALSYLGVWELPTPGLATGQSSEELQNKEGMLGAFFTGAFATVLATPCSGPFLGVALGYTIYLNSAQSFAVIMTVGLGMSLPYILLGLFPSAVKILPKPGNWMVTLKEFLAFLFLGTVAYFFNQFSDEQKLPVFVTLIGVWFGCWIIGKVPPWESLQKRLRGWVIGAGSAAAIGWLGFVYLEDTPEAATGEIQYVVDDHLRWEKYSEPRLQQLQSEGKTVMLDFTAAWCPNCILNTEIAFDTEPTSKLIDQLDAVPMLADMTDLPADIVDKLENEFGSKSIPLLAIYPGSSPGKPIVLRDIVTQSMILDALNQAGPSVGTDHIAGRPVIGQRLTSTSARPEHAAPSSSR